MTDDFAKVLDTMTAAATEPEDYAGEDGLLYCGKCRTPKEAFFPADKAALFGRDRHPAECDCQRARRMEREAAEQRRKHLDTVEDLKRRGFTDPKMREWTFANDNGKCPQMDKARNYVERWGADESRELWSALVGQGRHREKLFCRVYRQRPYGAGNPRPHDKLCPLSSMTLPPASRGVTSTLTAFAATPCLSLTILEWNGDGVRIRASLQCD